MLIKTMSKLLILVLLLFTITKAQTQKEKIIVASINGQNITLKEFEKAYLKNIVDTLKAKTSSIKEYKNFLNLYVNFKMKLKEAQEKGLYNDASINNELKTYKEQIASGFLIEKKIIQPEIKKLYDLRKWEYRVSHIMIIPTKGKETQSLKLANDLLSKLKKGASFEALAKQYSNDKYSGKEGGDIYYITAGELPIEFENAVYKTKVGSFYQKVVETKFGYHIIKVTDKLKRVAEIRVSHILINFKNKGKTDIKGANKQAEKILMKIKQGEDFATLANIYTNDKSNRNKGGDLGFFPRKQMVRPFDEAAFKLKKIGDVSGIIKTRFGFHIIKLTGKTPIISFEKEKAKLIKLFKKTRFQNAYNELAKGLKTKYKFNVNKKNLILLIKTTDTLKVGKENSNLKKIEGTEIFSIAGKSIKVKEFVSYLKSEKKYNNKVMNSEFLKRSLNDFGKNKAIEIESSRLELLNPQFAALLKEYKKGLIIFKLQQDEVWSKIKIDKKNLFKFYLKTKNNYKTKAEVNFSEIFSLKDSLITYYGNLIRKGASFDSLAALYTERSPTFKKNKGNWGYRKADFNDLTKKVFTLNKPGDMFFNFKNFGGYSIIRLNNKILSKLKSYAEAKNEVSAAFQDIETKRLEKEYIDTLKNKFHPIFYYNGLIEAFK